MAGTDQYNFSQQIKKRPSISNVTDIIIEKENRWQEAFGRKLTPDEVTILVDCIWSGVEYMEELFKE